MLNVGQCWNNMTELVRAVIGSDACVRRRQLVKGIGCTFLKLPEILLFNFETHIVSIDIWISTSRLIFFHLIFTHLYWASVMLGLKGRPFTDLPVRILREIGRFGNIFWFAKFLFYLVETTYFPSGSRSSMWDVSPKSEGGCLSSGPKPPWYASIIGSKRGAKTK